MDGSVTMRGFKPHPGKPAFGFLPGIAAKPSWKPFKAGCQPGDSQAGFSIFLAFFAFYSGFRGGLFAGCGQFWSRRNYRKPIGILTKGLRDKLHVQNRAKARQTAREKRDKLHVTSRSFQKARQTARKNPAPFRITSKNILIKQQ